MEPDRSSNSKAGNLGRRAALQASVAQDPVLLGMLLGLGSAVIYTGANSCLRAVTDLDSMFVSWSKALPLALIYYPWWQARVVRGVEKVPGVRAILILIVAGIVGQLGGNVLFQWSLGVIGLAMAVAVCLASMATSAAALGWLLLGERVSRKTQLALVVIVAAVVALFLGARATPPIEPRDDARLAVAASGSAEDRTDGATSRFEPPSSRNETSIAVKVTESPWFWAAAGTGAAFASGVAYTILGTLIRKGVTGETSVIGTLWVIGLIGAVVLGIGALLRVDGAEIARISPGQWACLLGAGLLNALAFLALTKSLQLAPVVIVNAVNASQSALAAVAGVLIFGEPLTFYLVVGVGLTAAGFLMLRGPSRTPETVTTEVSADA